jgi:hypothetical protein
MRKVRALRMICRYQEMLIKVRKGRCVNSGPKVGDILAALKVGLVVGESGADMEAKHRMGCPSPADARLGVVNLRGARGKESGPVAG